MKYICNFSHEANTAQQAEAIRRFKETGGQPPAGVRLLGRWIRADFTGGTVLLETDDAKGLMEFGLMWSDLMTLTIVPVRAGRAGDDGVLRAPAVAAEQVLLVDDLGPRPAELEIREAHLALGHPRRRLRADERRRGDEQSARNTRLEKLAAQHHGLTCGTPRSASSIFAAGYS